jgi:hypothetical protein
MSSRLLALVLCTAAQVAHAEAGWLASTARIDATQRFAVFGGPNDVGAGAQLAWAFGTQALSLEASWALAMRNAEARVAHLWLLRRREWVSLSASVGGSLIVVPGPLDVGFGPHGTFTVNIGRRPLSLQIGLQTGAEAFVRAFGPRFVERLFLGITGRAGPVGWGVLSRAGVDLEPGQPFVGRADVILALSWLR